MADSEDVIAQLEKIRFTPVRLKGDGYDMGEVDEFLDQLAGAARAGEPFGRLVAGVRFTKVRLREAYNADEVDAFLARMSTVVPVSGERAAREAAAGPRVNALVDRIRSAQFRRTMVRPGYSVTDVDLLLDQLVEAALSDRSLQPLLGSVSFTAKRWTEGYAPADVDGFLRSLAAG